MNALSKRPAKAKLSKKVLDSIRSEMAEAHGEHGNNLLRRALHKTNDPDMSQDLVQTTFLKTLVYLQRGGKVDLMRSFLNHVLNDLIIDEYRKGKLLSLDVLLKRGLEPGSDEYMRNADVLDGKKIILLIPLLPEKYELVIRLRYLNGLSLKEMALLTGQSENTVAVQAHRGLKKLRQIYVDIDTEKDRSLAAKT